MLQPALGEGGAEAAPVVADGRLYVSTDYDVVTAFDLRTRAALAVRADARRREAVLRTREPRRGAGARHGVPRHARLAPHRARRGHRRLWRWYAIPSPAEGGWWGRWAPNALTGGPVWAQPAYDPASGLLYVTVGNPAPSNDGRARRGDNLYTASVVALDVATGTLRWYLQAIPHDVWDSDLATPPVIVRDGGRPVLLVAGKTGWLYVLDATTGALVGRSTRSCRSRTCSPCRRRPAW